MNKFERNSGNISTDILKALDETVEIVPYNHTCPELFEQEAQEIKKIFNPNRLACTEHYGSTSIPNLHAKPIIDILVGLNTFKLSDEEKKGLESLGYEYIGRARTYERYFLKKRATHDFNLAVVRYAGDVWHESLTVREYLRAHDHVARAYEHVKLQALMDGCSTAFTYACYKHDFVVQLIEDAKVWLQRR